MHSRYKLRGSPTFFLFKIRIARRTTETYVSVENFHQFFFSFNFNVKFFVDISYSDHHIEVKFVIYMYPFLRVYITNFNPITY